MRVYKTKPGFTYSMASNQSLASSAFTARSASRMSAFKPRRLLNGALGGKYEFGSGVGCPFCDILKQGDKF